MLLLFSKLLVALF